MYQDKIQKLVDFSRLEISLNSSSTILIGTFRFSSYYEIFQIVARELDDHSQNESTCIRYEHGCSEVKYLQR